MYSLEANYRTNDKVIYASSVYTVDKVQDDRQSAILYFKIPTTTKTDSVAK